MVEGGGDGDGKKGLDVEDGELLADIAECLSLAEETLAFEKIYARDVVRRMEHASEADRVGVLAELAMRATKTSAARR